MCNYHSDTQTLIQKVLSIITALALVIPNSRAQTPKQEQDELQDTDKKSLA